MTHQWRYVGVSDVARAAWKARADLTFFRFKCRRCGQEAVALTIGDLRDFVPSCDEVLVKSVQET